jgi:hypothetical protein
MGGKSHIGSLLGESGFIIDFIGFRELDWKNYYSILEKETTNEIVLSTSSSIMWARVWPFPPKEKFYTWFLEQLYHQIMHDFIFCLCKLIQTVQNLKNNAQK